jgi:PAS domain S-box-containing protein
MLESMSAGNSGAAEYSYYEFEDSNGEYTRDKKEEKLMAYTPIHLGNELWAIGVWAPKEDARKLIRTAYHRQLSMVVLGILTILTGSSIALVMSSRLSKFLEQEVETKTGELKESHERLLTVLDSLDAAVYVADMETYEILFVNKYLRNLFGDVMGKTCWQALQAGQSGPCDFCTNEKLLTADGEPSGEYSWEFQNTVTGRWYEIRDRAIRWVDGRIVRLEIAIDITERKQAEEELQKSEEQYRRLVELSPDAIGIQSENAIVFMNSAGVDLFGAEKAEQLIGKSVWDFVLPEYREIVEGRYRQMREKGTKVPFIELKLVRLDGTNVDAEVTAIPFIYNDKPAIQAVFRDITERKLVEEALLQYAKRLRALTAQRAEVVEAERQRLARELHDQVGQNLTALGINLNIIRTQMPEEAAAPMRSRLDDSLSLVEQTAARIRDVMADLRPPVLDDYGLVAALHWYGERFARRTDIAVAVEGEEPVPRLAAHVENALFRIAQEALTNVAKHAQATRVAVTVEVDSGTLRLVVADDGIGFDPAHLAAPPSFPPNGGEERGGRGWGMLTMTERAEAVGGRCRIESDRGQGAQVIVEVAR